MPATNDMIQAGQVRNAINCSNSPFGNRPSISHDSPQISTGVFLPAWSEQKSCGKRDSISLTASRGRDGELAQGNEIDRCCFLHHGLPLTVFQSAVFIGKWSVLHVR